MRRVSRLSRVSGYLYSTAAPWCRRGHTHRLSVEEVAPTGKVALDRARVNRVSPVLPEATALSLALDEDGYTTAAEATLVGAVTLMFLLSALMYFGQSVRTASTRLAAQLRVEESRILEQRPVQRESESSICGRPDG